MRELAIGFLLLAACDRNAGDDQSTAEATPAALIYDGGDYKTDAEKVAHGKRLAVILDCTGCHGDKLQGYNATTDDPDYGEMNAPNLTLIGQQYSDKDFHRLLRDGVPKDGREFWFMPVESFQFLSEPDMAAVIAYVRSFKPEGRQLPPIKKGKGFYEDLDRGFGNSLQQVARYRADPPPDMGSQFERGRALTRITCTSCHNAALQGYQGFTPNLDIAGAYSKAELSHLLTTGEGKTKKNLGMMSDMVRRHLTQLTPGEREAIVDYVIARANRVQQPQ
jgi:mono/diheme cytochrome c family protein